jgi:hypothetical protein
MGLEDCHYIVHTDAWYEIDTSPSMRRLKRFCEVEYRPLPREVIGHQRLTACHLDAMKDAEAILFLMPDGVPDVEAFTFVKSCRKKLVAIGTLRTHCERGEEYPLHARELAEWSVKHLHPNWAGLIWGASGGAMPPTHLYFQSETGFWMHGFHLHPLAAVLDDNIRTKIGADSTIDGDFVSFFDPKDVYVVADREVAVADITPRSKGENEGCWEVSNPVAIANFMRSRANPMHQHFFRHRIMLAGTYDKFAESIPFEILDKVIQG